jgi:hypothetical protein
MGFEQASSRTSAARPNAYIPFFILLSNQKTGDKMQMPLKELFLGEKYC